MKSIGQRNGFATYLLSNSALKIEVVPQLGAKIVSLQSVRTGREWMWRLQSDASLFPNVVGDAFEASPMVGADECFPTVGPCIWKGRDLPDHGEVWSSAWDVDQSAFSQDRIRTCVRLPVSPFRFERTISLQGDAAHFEYAVFSYSAVPERFLWAFHPLLVIEPGDLLELPSGIDRVQVGAVKGFPDETAQFWLWPEPFPDVHLDRIDFGPFAPGYAKLFADLSTTNEGFVAIRRGSERLLFRFDTSVIPAIGIWFTRGAWHGHTHMAIEPTNSAADELSAISESVSNIVPPFGEIRWRFQIQVLPSS